MLGKGTVWFDTLDHIFLFFFFSVLFLMHLHSFDQIEKLLCLILAL